MLEIIIDFFVKWWKFIWLHWKQTHRFLPLCIKAAQQVFFLIDFSWTETNELL